MNIPRGVGETFDGEWSHQRKAYLYQTVFIESNNHKIISSKVLYKDYRCHQGNSDNKKPPNLMEVTALKLMKDDLLDQRIQYFTSDSSVKIRNVIRKLKRAK